MKKTEESSELTGQLAWHMQQATPRNAVSSKVENEKYHPRLSSDLYMLTMASIPPHAYTHKQTKKTKSNTSEFHKYSLLRNEFPHNRSKFPNVHEIIFNRTLANIS